MNLIDFLQSAHIEDLNLPTPIIQKLQKQKVADFKKIHSALQAYRVFGKCSIKGLSEEEISILDRHYTDVLVANGLMKRKSYNGPVETQSSRTQPPIATKPTVSSSRGNLLQSALNEAKEVHPNPEPIKSVSVAGQSHAQSPLSVWEFRLGSQLRKAELIGEVAISKEELDDISLHIRELFQKRSEEDVLRLFRGDYPATFLVFMVGTGIYGYDCGDFWPSI